MSDFEQMVKILNAAGIPHFEYTQLGAAAHRHMVLDEQTDGGRHVPLLIFDISTGKLLQATTRWMDL
jgi:hypothetical protein